MPAQSHFGFVHNSLSSLVVYTTTNNYAEVICYRFWEIAYHLKYFKSLNKSSTLKAMVMMKPFHPPNFILSGTFQQCHMLGMHPQTDNIKSPSWQINPEPILITIGKQTSWSQSESKHTNHSATQCTVLDIIIRLKSHRNFFALYDCA